MSDQEQKGGQPVKEKEIKTAWDLANRWANRANFSGILFASGTMLFVPSLQELFSGGLSDPSFRGSVTSVVFGGIFVGVGFVMNYLSNKEMNKYADVLRRVDIGNDQEGNISAPRNTNG